MTRYWDINHLPNEAVEHGVMVIAASLRKDDMLNTTDEGKLNEVAREIAKKAVKIVKAIDVEVGAQLVGEG